MVSEAKIGDSQTKNPEKKQALFLESPVKKQKNGTNGKVFFYKEKEEEEGRSGRRVRSGVGERDGRGRRRKRI